ncbi:hypothetical protein [Edaphobacter albus]|uniref:hypothetical protein n=1 Tax=Edaphobacter sp. 4G125 TaxID=2763071 RepID=UPI0016461E22|nr:hypothetical protein [Edaphobacter sp. 4G125]QNI37630.1 hypothetical protein H7846_04890 [Edaphobacter sp. 4G125]
MSFFSASGQYCRVLLCLLLPSSALAQAAARTPVPADPSAIVASLSTIPLDLDQPDANAILPNFNAGITFTSVHDSLTGWSTLAIPSVSYTINNTFFIEGNIPIYFYRLAESKAAHPKPDKRLVKQRGELGDAFFSLHALFTPERFSYETILSFTAPTGDTDYGLTTGRVTFDINNRFSRNYRRLTPLLEIGAGDSATLVNRQVKKNYTSLGPLAHFQLGFVSNLSRWASFESDLYEQLPIGDQKIYSAYRKGRPTIVIGHNVTEDNGFINAIDIPLNRKTILSSYYNRSLRRGIDDVGISLTFTLHGAPSSSENLSFDELMR